MEIIFEGVNYNIDKKEMFEDLNVKFKHNNITGIIGPSGSGKSCILEIISTFRDIDSGKVSIGDMSITSKTKKRDLIKIQKYVGMLFQSSYDQIYNLTVKKELLLSISDLKLSKKDMLLRIEQALKLVELNNEILEKNPFYLSQSELKKVALASVLVRDSEVLLLDEPTAGLDNNGKKMLVNLLRLLRKKYEKTIIVVSSDIDFLNQIADDIVVLKKGKIILQGNRLDVFKSEKFLIDNGIQIPKIIEFENYVLNEKGIKIGYREEINDLLKDIFRYAK